MEKNGKFYSFKKNEENGYSEELKNCIETTFQYCIENATGDSEEKINKPIMMLGKIQSGKTRAYTGLIALAFDNDFDMVFILSKNSKALINQTVSRMKKEFRKFIKSYDVVVSDIMKSNKKISGYQLEQKNIIIAKKEKNNINRLIDFIKEYSINEKKRCLIIDDEADTTGIGYSKKKGENEYTLRMVSSKVNEMRGSLDGCVFVEVTATPYALYLQPEFEKLDEIHPIKPLNTVLVPFGKDYIGGDYYFIKSKDIKHPASFLYEAVGLREHEIVSDQKRKGKKSKIEDKRVFKVEEILVNEDKLPVFKKGLINFFVGVIVLMEKTEQKGHYAYVIHTATQKGSHFNLQNVTEKFLKQMRDRNKTQEKIIEKMLTTSYMDIKQSVVAYDMKMPSYEYVKEQFYYAIDKEYYSVDVVNSDNDVEALLNEETGELRLPTLFSIFVGGQVLDRGVTIPNMIGFYYGRNPKTMQQDTVLQHSRMFGYRKYLLPVTRFYTTERIYSNMEKITEIDSALREDIKSGKQGSGVYFITRKEQDSIWGNGYIKPCSPDKIRVSDILLLRGHKRLLPVGFSPVCKIQYDKMTKNINKILNETQKIDENVYLFELKRMEELLVYVYKTFTKDEDSYRFISLDEMLASLKYFAKNDLVYCNVYRNVDVAKYKKDFRLEDSPDTGQTHYKKAKELAIENPCCMLFQENGMNTGWNGKSFWWPVLVAPKNVPKTIYASKTVAENIVAFKE